MDGKDYLIVLGAPKCGTTSLAAWLAQLPDTALSRTKETMFFTDFAGRSWSGPGAGFAEAIPVKDAEFRAQFAHAPDAGLRIEASTDNLSCAAAWARIKAFSERDEVASVRLVAILRDPVERIVSEFEHTLRFGWQPNDFTASLRAEKERRDAGWHPLFGHIFRSRYYEQLERFRSVFPRDQLLVLDYHELGDARTLARLAAFAGRDATDIDPQLARKNAREVHARPRSKQLLKNQTALKLARSFTPKPLRARVRRIVSGPQVARIEPHEVDRAYILRALRVDVRNCIGDPDIPTSHWSCAGHEVIAGTA